MIDCRANLPHAPELSELNNPDWCWHIALCRPGQDNIAARNLRNLRYVIRQPKMVAIKRRRGGQYEPHWEPMFPGYIFILPAGQSWERLRIAPGMHWGDNALLMINGRFATLKGDDPDFLAMLETERRLQQMKSKQAEPLFKIGDRVQIKAGPWVDFWGVLERLTGKERVDVLLDMLGRKVRAHVRLEHLSPVS